MFGKIFRGNSVSKKDDFTIPNPTNSRKKENFLMFRFEINPHFGHVIERGLDYLIDFDSNFVPVPKKEFKILIEDIAKMKEFEKIAFDREKEISKLNNELNDWKKKYEDIKERFDSYQREAVNEKESLNKKISEYEENKQKRDKQIQTLVAQYKEQQQELKTLKEV
jgi:hypothetical protein